jgi:hypothetical protein
MNGRLTRVVFIALLVGTLAGCAPTPDIGDDTARSLQASVQKVSALAAADDPQAAIAELDALQSALDAAVTAGDVGSDRSATVQKAIDLVRTDLEQRVVEAQAEAEAAAAQQAAQAEADRLAEEQAANDRPSPGKGPKPDKKPK